ncbi:hypothetical protein [uncultured Phenylobacterium sp.]|uniref:hypothetical protein n=1 Tax=uncultured Phenylobacterium sp. TaxID=349273 RepID=UPI0025EBAE83|nr:hypothetical protein [uncultured Phenylobacterium sp.]
MRLAPAALLLGLALCSSASAQVQARTRPDAVGDTYRYRSETRYAEKSRDGMEAQVNSQVFELKVLGVSPEGLRVRYTLVEATVADTAGPAMKAPLQAAVGGVLDFRMDRNGMVTAVDNWPDYKARFLGKIDAALPAGDQIRNIVHQRMNQDPVEAAQDLVLGDLALLRAMELRGPVALGRVESLDTRRRPPPRVVTETSVKTPGCVLHINRVTTGTTVGAVQKTTADADVSVKDGRVLSFTQNRVERAGATVVDERLMIKRLSAAPGCP